MKLFTLFLITLLSIDSWATKVLQIGGSHTVGAFGNSLYKELSLNSNVTSARSIGLASANGIHYSSHDAAQRTLNYGYIDRPQMTAAAAQGTVDQLSTMLNKDKPDVLIVELADNFADYRESAPSDAFVKNNIQKILGQIQASNSKPSECFWVGPTWTDWVDENGLPVDNRKSTKEGKKIGTFYKKSTLRAQQVASLIKNEISGKCTFIDSLKILDKTEVKTSDGIHCNQASGTLWGQEAYKEIAKTSHLLSGKTKTNPTHNTTSSATKK